MPHSVDFSELEAIASIEAFRALAPEDIRKLARIGRFIEVPRGEILVRQGERADVLYYVLTGRFAVEIEGRPGQINEIRRGEPIGEIAFFRGGVRTANVRAKRASLVLAFNHDQMDELSRSAPRFSRAILTSLADRLARATPRMSAQVRPVVPKTLAIVPAGRGAVDRKFSARLAGAMQRYGKAVLVRAEDVRKRLLAEPDPHDVTTWIEEVEDVSDFAIFDLADFEPQLAMHVATTMDAIVLVGDASGAPDCGEMEAAILARAQDAEARLVLLHAQAAPVYPGTARWLRERPVTMHHHVASGVADDMARLSRFITGNARGFVASGGGAVCAAHVGVYRAFREKGVEFDIFGGTSAGAAMAAAFAYDLDAPEINARIEDMFITRRAMSRFTIPRYSLFDHQPFDEALRAHYGDVCIEDLHRPFFALSTNLSTGEEHIHREGKVWQAVRASGAIPGLLPPFYTAKGEMLVDGCLLDNVPLRIMHRLSSGPNVVAALRLSKAAYFDVAYDQLPGRWQIASAISRFLGGKPLPTAPGIAEVLMRAITLSPDTELTGGARDMFIVPPIAEDVGIMSWSLHAALAENAYRHTLAKIEELQAAGDPLIAELAGGGDG